MKKINYIILIIAISGCSITSGIKTTGEIRVEITQEVKTGFGKRTYKVDQLMVWHQEYTIKTNYWDIGDVGDIITLRKRKNGKYKLIKI